MWLEVNPHGMPGFLPGGCQPFLGFESPGCIRPKHLGLLQTFWPSQSCDVLATEWHPTKHITRARNQILCVAKKNAQRKPPCREKALEKGQSDRVENKPAGKVVLVGFGRDPFLHFPFGWFQHLSGRPLESESPFGG